jgi:hypothetical protein
MKQCLQRIPHRPTREVLPALSNPVKNQTRASEMMMLGRKIKSEGSLPVC